MGTNYDNLARIGVNRAAYDYSQPLLKRERARNPRGGRPFAESLGVTPSAPTAPAPVPYDPYANGGDGAVAREAAPMARNVSVGMGLPREELVRRMENASTSMRGSPTARAAMMGMYADGLKAYDQVGIDNNQGNIRHDGLAFERNMEANMQQARGKQQFGNDVALLNRKTSAELAITNASAAAKLDPEMRALQMDKIRAETANLSSKGAMDAAKYDTEAQSNADKAINARIEQLVGGSDDPAIRQQAGIMAARERIALMGDTDSAQGKAQLMSDGRNVGESLGAWKRLGGFWTDNNTRPIPAGAVVDPGDVTTDYGTAEDDNNFNDWLGWIPWVEKDRRAVYTNPATGEQHTQWLDPGESQDANVLNALDMYNTPAYRKKMEERRQLGQPKN